MSLTRQLFPAYAGVILVSAACLFCSFTFPRIRGGDPNTAKKYSDMEFFSPHTRG